MKYRLRRLAAAFTAQIGETIRARHRRLRQSRARQHVRPVGFGLRVVERRRAVYHDVAVGPDFLRPSFLFGFIYFYVKGMWRKGTTVLGAGVGIGIVLSVLQAPNFLSQAVTFGFAGAIMTTANYAYYLHVRGSQSWNPFEGFGPRR